MATQQPFEFQASSREEATQQRIDDLLAVVSRHPAVAAEVLKAADAILVDKEAYLELDFGDQAERAAEREIKPAQRLGEATSDTERGRIISANILGRASIYAKQLAAETEVEATDLP